MPDIEVLTDVGRIVWGHPLKLVPRTDDDGKPVMKEDGTPELVINFGLAVPKASFAAVSQAMSAAAVGIPGADQAGFAWKFKDGDTALDKNNKPLRDRPGYAGCYVLSISTGVRELSQVFRQTQPGVFVAMAEGEVKTGDFIRTKLKIIGHGPNPKKRGSKPGLYLNPQGHEFIGFGEAIFSGPDANSMFGGAPAAALPPGASATPIATGGGPGAFTPAPVAPVAAPIPGPTPGAPVPLAPTPGAIVPGAVPPMATPVAPIPGPVPTASPINPVAPVAPAHDFVQAAMPPGVVPAPAPVAPVAPVAPAAPAPGSMGRPVVAYHPTTGRAIYGYTPDAQGQQWPIYGFNPDGSPIYQ